MTAVEKDWSAYTMLSGVLADRPATPSIPAGALVVYQATDTDNCYIWSGAHWAEAYFAGIPAGSIALTNTHLLVGNGSNVAADVAMSGDAAIANTGAITVSKTGGVAFATSATTDTTNASNISGGTLSSGRLSGSYTGITGLGTVTAGTWNASTIDVAHGGTGDTTLTNHGVLLGQGTSAIAAVAAMSDGQLLVGQTGVDPLGKTLSGDATLAATGAISVTKTGGVSFAASATTDTTNAANITSGTLPNARIVALPNANLANSGITLNGHAVALGGALTLAGGDFALTDGHIFVGNGSNVAADVAMTGDVSITDTGITSVASAVGATFATTGPIFQLTGGSAIATVVNGEGVVSSTLYSANAVSATTAPNIVAKRSRGALAAPAKCSSGDDLARYNFQGYQDGTGTFGNGARIQVTTAEAFTSTTNLGTVGKFLACPTASGTLVESLRWAGTHASAPVGFSVGKTTAPTRLLDVEVADAVTAAVSFAGRLIHSTSGTAAASFGVGQEYVNENGVGVNVVAGSTAVRWVDATSTTEVSEFVIQTIDAGVLADKVRVTGKGYVVSPGNTRAAADVATTSAALADITGLSVNVRAGKTYAFEARLYLNAAALLTPNFAIAGTATATDIRMNNRLFNDPASGLTSNFTTTTALATTSGFTVTINGAGYVEITGTITVNAGGTLTVQHKTSTSTLTTKRGSTFIVTEID